jgi:hypothetical protein
MGDCNVFAGDLSMTDKLTRRYEKRRDNQAKEDQAIKALIDKWLRRI